MGEFAQLVKDYLVYLGPIDLPQYYVYSNKIKDPIETSTGKLAVEVHLILGRRIMNQILTNFLPTILLCLVSFATNHFEVSRIANSSNSSFSLHCFAIFRSQTLKQL